MPRNDAEITLDFIEKTLNAAIDPQTHTLVLDAPPPFGEPIRQIFDQYLDKKLHLKEALVSRLSNPDRVLLTGTGSSFPFDTLAARGYFTVATFDGEDVGVLDLIANASPDWTLPVSFPDLADTFLSEFQFSTAALALRSEDTSEGPKGLKFTAVLQLNGALGFLSTLFNGTSQLTMEAPIALDGTTPIFTMKSSEELAIIQIGSLPTIDFRLLAQIYVDDEGLEEAWDLDGAITYTQSGENKTLHILADLLSLDSGILHITTDLTDGPPLGFRQLRELFDNGDVNALLPPVFSALDNVALKSWEIYVLLQPLQLLNVAITVGTVKPWNIVPNLLDVGIDALTFGIALNPGDTTLSASLKATMYLGDPLKPGIIKLRAYFPGFRFSGYLAENSINVRWMVNRFLGESAASLVPEKLNIVELSLGIDPASSAYSFYTALDVNWTLPIGPLSFEIEKLKLSIDRVGQATHAMFGGNFNLLDGTFPVDVTAIYDSTEGWEFEGGLTKPVGVHDIINQISQKYFDGWQLSGFTLNLNLLRVWLWQATQSYRFQLDLDWTVSVGSFTFPKVRAEIDVTYKQQYSGFLRGTVSFEDFDVSVELLLPKQDVVFKVAGLEAVIEQEPKTRLVITFPNQSLGAFIEMLVSAAAGRPITLPAPWNVLNLVDLSGAQLIIGFDDKEIGFVSPKNTKIDLFFITITRFELWYRGGAKSSASRVDLKITGGQFLGKEITEQKPLPMNVLDPASAPKVPGAGEKVFALHFLAAGQRVGLKSPVDFKSATQALDELEKAFKKKDTPGETSPIAGTGLVPDQGANWLFAFRAEILSAITIRAVFVDPDLYGVAIAVGGTKLPKFTGLNFEILYKKVNENIGVYMIELKVPDYLRQLDFGTVSITLPIIAIEIFTNGEFRLDFGFPANGDFTRSFAIQVLPFTGAGGFYFAVLSSATSKRVPTTVCGSFSPVIEAGIGLRVGLGKDINKGILKAGLSVTMMGIVEGTLAFYNANDQNPLYDDARYYYISGQVAVVGQIYGEINFAIISARLDILIKIGVTLVAEALEAIRFGFFAQVSVSLTVKINLGIFKIEISLSFSASIQEQFLIGSSNPNKPWNQCIPAGPQRAIRGLRLDDFAPPAPPELVFHPLTVAQPVRVDLKLVPQLTAGSETIASSAKARFVVMLYVKTSTGSPEPVETDFDRLARGIFLWTMAAFFYPQQKETPAQDVSDHAVSLDDLQAVYQALTLDPVKPLFEKPQLIAFFEKYFLYFVKLAVDSGQEEMAGVFPMLTPLVLVRPDGSEVHFDSEPEVPYSYLGWIRDYFKATALDARSPEEVAANLRASLARAANDPAPQSMAAWMMVDYVSLIARDSLQAAIDTLSAFTTVAGEGESIDDILARYPRCGLTAEDLARGNSTRALTPGVKLAIPRFWYRPRRGDQADEIAGRFSIASANLEAHARDKVAVNGVMHEIGGAADQTLLGIARSYGVELEELARANAHVKGLFRAGRRVLLPFVEGMTVGQLLDEMQEARKFEHMAGASSRYLLHGLRPPPPGAEITAPLYQLNLQQFDASALAVGDSFRITVDSALDWLMLDAPQEIVPPSITISVTEAEAQIIQQFNNAALDPEITTLQASPFERLEARAYALGSAIVWRPLLDPRLANGRNRLRNPGDLSIWAFPQNLQRLLLDHPELDPLIEVVESAQDAENLPPYSIRPSVPEAAYSWAARLDVTVRRVVTQAREVLPNTYELADVSVASNPALQRLLNFDSESSPVDQIHVLYGQNPTVDASFNGLLSLPAEEIGLFLLQTNLSNEANPNLGAVNGARAAVTNLIGQDPTAFLRFVWEAGVVRSGGYYLYYRSHSGGKGLPDYLFNDTEETGITLLVTLKNNDDRLQPYMNAMVVTKDVDITRTAFFLRAVFPDIEKAPPELVERVPAIPPGCVAFEAERTPAQTQFTSSVNLAAVPVQPYLRELYNLMNFQVATFGGYGVSPFALPAGPLDEQHPAADLEVSRAPKIVTDQWRYKAVMPVYRFASEKTVAADGVPDPKSNPYRGVNEEVAIEVTWLDLFGNTMPIQGGAGRVQLTVPYFDPLLAVEKWPSIAADYIVHSAGGTPTLEIKLGFQPDRYLPPPKANEEPANIKAARADRAVYALIYYQLTQPGVTAAFGSTLSSQTGDGGAALVEYLKSIYAFLDAIVNGKPYTLPGDRTLTVAVADQNLEQYYQLLAWIAIARPGGEGSDDPVYRVQSAIAPRYHDQNSDSAVKQELLTLREFARLLEEAFPNLAVATAAPRVQAELGSPAREMWLARFGGANGIVYDIKDSAVLYYAPLPVSRSLLQVDAWIYPYRKGSPIWGGTQQQQFFNGVDGDLQAKSFLEAVDRFLSPQFVVPGWLAQNESGDGANPIQQVLDAKKRLAASVAERIAPVFANQEPKPGRTKRAREAVEQRLLQLLGNLYAVDCIVQFPVAITSAFSDKKSAPHVFGKPVTNALLPRATAANVQDYSFSTAEIDLWNEPDQSALTFLFTTRDASAGSPVTVPLVYQRSNLQYGFEDVPGVKNYRASRWLAFVTLNTDEPGALRAIPSRGGQTDLGTLEIPVPLRSYPPSPMLSEQTGQWQPPLFFQASHNPMLQVAKTWRFRFTYIYDSAFQDTVHAEVTFNVPIEAARSRRTAAGDEPDLPAALMQFSTVYADVQRDLELSLIGQPDAALASTTMQTFAWLVERVATAWDKWDSTAARFVAEGTFSANLAITQSSVKIEGVEYPVFLITVKCTTTGRELWPMVELEGYQAVRYSADDKEAAFVYKNDGKYLSAEDGRRIAARSVVIPDLDLLAEQSGWAGALVRRNETLAPSKETNPAFVYETPQVRFASPIAPLLEPGMTINVADSSEAPPATGKLYHYLENFLRDVFHSATTGEVAAGGRLSIAGSYTYPLNQDSADAQVDIALPIFLTPPVTVTTETPKADEIPLSDYARQIADAIALWMPGRVHAEQHGKFKFGLTLYSNLTTTTQLPVLKLENINLDAELILNGEEA